MGEDVYGTFSEVDSELLGSFAGLVPDGIDLNDIHVAGRFLPDYSAGQQSRSCAVTVALGTASSVRGTSRDGRGRSTRRLTRSGKLTVPGTRAARVPRMVRYSL